MTTTTNTNATAAQVLGAASYLLNRLPLSTASVESWRLSAELAALLSACGLELDPKTKHSALKALRARNKTLHASGIETWVWSGSTEGWVRSAEIRRQEAQWAAAGRRCLQSAVDELMENIGKPLAPLPALPG